MEDKNVTKEMLVDLYIHQSRSIDYMKNMFNVYRGVIKRWLKECNIIKRNNNSKYIFNEKYFDNINTPEKAYWLGFIWCDGYICKRKRKYGIAYEFKLDLAEQDKEHLIKLNKSLESNYDIKTYKSETDYNKNGVVCRLYISNKYFASNLYNNYGLIPNRHEVDILLNKIPKIYYRDFIRGILDSEGSLVHGLVYDNQVHKKVYKCHINFSTYENLLVFIQNVFYENKLIFNNSKLYKRHEEENKDGYCKQITYCGGVQVPRILKWLYKDATIYLERKYNKYKDILYYTSIN
jgi:hypothetical protein